MNKEIDTPLKLLKVWMTAVRVRTFPIPIIQVVVGISLAYAHLGFLDLRSSFFTSIVALFITIGTNLINDVYDHEKGGDLKDSAGYKKVITAGLISKQSLFIAGLGAFLAAILCSIPLAIEASWWVFFLVILCCIIGFGYTGGLCPICYLGLSEVFILGFYGFVLVGVSYYIQTSDFSTAAFICALQMGLLAIIPNALNNFRDTYDDAKVNKLTLAVRFGVNFARNEISFCVLFPFFLNLYWFFNGYSEAVFLSFLLIPLAYYFLHGVRKGNPGPGLNPYFPLSILLHFGFGLLLSFGFILRS